MKIKLKLINSKTHRFIGFFRGNNTLAYVFFNTSISYSDLEHRRYEKRDVKKLKK